MWLVDDLAGAAAAGLRHRDRELNTEQATRGIDALPELELHAVLRAGFAAAGYGVFAEQPYPGIPLRRALRRDRERCDIVLTLPESAGLPLADPVLERRQEDEAAATLFAAAIAPPPGVSPAEAFWIEVKAVGQCAFCNGVPGPNQSYSSELVRGPIADVEKLSRDGVIASGAALLVHFTADEAVARHDLGMLLHRCLDRDLPVCEPVAAGFPITDRIGNGWCSVAVIRVRAGGGGA